MIIAGLRLTRNGTAGCARIAIGRIIAVKGGRWVGWNRTHTHGWTIWTTVTLPVEALGEDDDGSEFIAEVPFVPWVCECGAWKWKISPEVYSGEFI